MFKVVRRHVIRGDNVPVVTSGLDVRRHRHQSTFARAENASRRRTPAYPVFFRARVNFYADARLLGKCSISECRPQHRVNTVRSRLHVVWCDVQLVCHQAVVGRETRTTTTTTKTISVCASLTGVDRSVSGSTAYIVTSFAGLRTAWKPGRNILTMCCETSRKKLRAKTDD